MTTNIYSSLAELPLINYFDQLYLFLSSTSITPTTTTITNNITTTNNNNSSWETTLDAPYPTFSHRVFPHQSTPLVLVGEYSMQPTYKQNNGCSLSLSLYIYIYIYIYMHIKKLCAFLTVRPGFKEQGIIINLSIVNNKYVVYYLFTGENKPSKLVQKRIKKEEFEEWDLYVQLWGEQDLPHIAKQKQVFFKLWSCKRGYKEKIIS